MCLCYRLIISYKFEYWQALTRHKIYCRLNNMLATIVHKDKLPGDCLTRPDLCTVPYQNVDENDDKVSRILLEYKHK